MLIVTKLRAVRYTDEFPEHQDDYEIDVFFKNTKDETVETVRIPFGVLRQLHESIKEEKDNE